MSLGIKTLQSSIIILCIRMIHRGIGIISMLILARLLSPEDFGVVAIASMVVFFCDVLTESGGQQYIIQKKELDRDDIDTSWTLNIALKLTVCIIFLLLASPIADYFENPDLRDPLRLIALILPIGALATPGLHLLKREFHYKPIMRLLVTEKVISVILTLSVAYWLRSYWAMIIGVVLSYSIRSIGSYWIHSYKPRLCFSKVKEQWSFSKWMLLKGAVGYSKSEFDTFLVSKLFDFTAVGGFNMMKNLSSMPAREIIKPVTEPLLASFSKVRDDRNKLNQQILFSISLLIFGTAPIAGFLWEYDSLIVQLLFDDRWWHYAPVLGILSILIINFSLVSVLHEALIAIQKVKLLFYYDLSTLFLIVTVLLTLNFNSLEEFALARSLVLVLSVTVLTIIVGWLLKLNLLKLAILILPPLFGAYLAFSLTNQVTLLDQQYLVVNLLAKGVLFCLFYLLFALGGYLMLMWRTEVKELRDFVVYLTTTVINKRSLKEKS